MEEQKPRKLAMLGGRVAVAGGSSTQTVQPGSWRTSGQTSGKHGYDYGWKKARAATYGAAPYGVYCMREAGIEATGLAEVILEWCGARAACSYGNGSTTSSRIAATRRCSGMSRIGRRCARRTTAATSSGRKIRMEGAR